MSPDFRAYFDMHIESSNDAFSTEAAARSEVVEKLRYAASRIELGFEGTTNLLDRNGNTCGRLDFGYDTEGEEQ